MYLCVCADTHKDNIVNLGPSLLYKGNFLRKLTEEEELPFGGTGFYPNSENVLSLRKENQKPFLPLILGNMFLNDVAFLKSNIHIKLQFLKNRNAVARLK